MALNVDSNVLHLFEDLSSRVPIWNIDLPKHALDIDEDSKNFDVLSELVRNTYLKCLRQTLLNNLDVTSDYKNNHHYQIQNCVDICIAEMEKQALRQCMIASIYREGMSNLINKVKTCTKNSMLYVLLKHIIESNNQIPSCDKLLEAKNITKPSVTIDVGVNTEQKCYKIASTQTEIWTDLDNNLPNNLTVHKVSTDLVNKSNLLSSSYNVKSEISGLNIFNDLNSLLQLSCFSNTSPDTHMEVNSKYESTEFENVQGKNEQENSTSNDILSINALLRDLQDSSPEYEQPSLKLEERLSENHKSTENLTKLNSLINISPSIIRPNKINEILMDKFKSKRVAKSYQLRKTMNELPQYLQIRLNQKFNDLFGYSHSYECDPLSEEEERIIAHKRIVKMVVEFMTPYYKAHRINRHLFKSLAKLISKNLMDRAFDPDENTVSKGVSEFFTGNRCIKTVEDIYINN